MANIAIPLTSDFEDSEFTVPYESLKNAGHTVTVFGNRAGETVKGKRGEAEFSIDTEAEPLKTEAFDALLIPGGYSPDRLRLNPQVVDFVRRFQQSGKPVAAICHGPQLLIEADGVKGRTLTSWPSVKTDLLNAGAEWVDKAVVVDGNLITSRKPADLDAFCEAVHSQLAA